MSLTERETLIIIIVCSIVGFLLFLIIICIFFWLIIRHYQSKSKRLSANDETDSPVVVSSRPHYRRAQKMTKKKDPNKKRTKRRFHTNESIISMSFDPPHLINQNVKNLDQLFNYEPTMTGKSWHFDETPPIDEPVYASSSTVLTSISNLAVPMPLVTDVQQRFLTELDHVLRSKQNQHRSIHPIKYSQSCRERTEPLPFDYYRRKSPEIVVDRISSPEQFSSESLFDRTTNYSNATLVRKARLGQLRDDTAILY